MSKKSKELNDFENKLRYLLKDWKELFLSLLNLLKQGWYLGMDISKAIVQTVTIWELIPNIPEFIKIGKYFGKLFELLKFKSKRK